MNKPQKQIPSEHELQPLADRAATTTRTLRSWLKGGTTKARIGARMKQALLDAGRADLLPDAEGR
jgi:hypothetical protein